MQFCACAQKDQKRRPTIQRNKTTTIKNISSAAHPLADLLSSAATTTKVPEKDNDIITTQTELQHDHFKPRLSFFECEIQKFREIADNKRGISWQLTDDLLIRRLDGNNLKEHLSLYAAEDYVVIILNKYRAASKICLLHRQKKACKDFEKNAKEFLDKDYKLMAHENEDRWIDCLKKVDREIIEYLKTLFPLNGSKKIAANFKLAENYVGLDDPHYNITTIVKIEDTEFHLKNERFLKLTKAQKKQFKKRMNKQWYKSLDPFEQKFIDAYSPKFLDGKHYFPTQIRKIPGCRNGYKKIITARSEQGEQELGYYYHSGMLASFAEKNYVRDKIAQHNWKQLVQYVEDGKNTEKHKQRNKNVKENKNKHIVFICLNTKIPIQCEDKIVKQTKEVIGDNSKFMHLPINNAYGLPTSFTFNDHIKQLLHETAKIYPKEYKSIYNNSQKGYDHTIQKIQEEIKDPKLQSYFKKLTKLKEYNVNEQWKMQLKASYDYLIKKDNPYANIGAHYVACNALLKQHDAQAPTIVFGCKSGKDRTGFLSYLVDNNIIHTHYPTLDRGKLYTALAYASHYQLLASLNGGMPGRFGMKKVAENLDIKEIDKKADATAEPLRKLLFPKAAQQTDMKTSS